FFAIQGTKCRTGNYRNIVSIVLVERKQFPNFHFNQFKKLWIIYQIHFVHENYKSRNTYLTGKKDVLSGLWHWSISGSNYKNCTVHLGSASCHVLHVVSVTWTVNVCIVTVFGLILHVRRVDRDTSFFFFWSVVDRRIIS